MASTLRMPTTISPGQWQPWTAVSPLLGLISMAAVGSKTLYCRGECKSAILAYMAGIRSEREGGFFFSPQYPHPFMHLPSKLHPMKGNPDTGMRKFLPVGSEIRKILLAESGILGFEVQNTASGIHERLKSRVQVLVIETEI